jgi:hypothetical protein
MYCKLLKTTFTRRKIMTYRTFAASILALGLLAPAAFADGTNSTDGQGCPDIRKQTDDFADCQGVKVNPANGSYGVVVQQRAPRGSIGDFIDETAEEKNQRSSQ